ncbi:MAG TPA: RraA family protein [Limnochordales bacterium]
MDELSRLIEGFLRTTTASISDALDRRGIRGFMSSDVKPRTVARRIAGPAVPVREVPSADKQPPLLAIEAIDAAAPGSIIVIGADNAPEVALWGGLMSAAARARGLAGAVLDGGVRDVVEIRRDHDFPVYARSAVPSTTVGRYVTVERDVPVWCGGVQVHPGDIVVADDDGVVVVPRAIAGEVLQDAMAIDEVEARMTAELRQGRPFMEVFRKHARI